MSDDWRRWLYIGPAGEGMDDTLVEFVVACGPAAGVPQHGQVMYIPDYHPAVHYWKLREGWRTLGQEAFEELYAKWQPKRDAVLAKEEHLGKSKADWERFFLALADERAAREYAVARVGAAFGVNGRELLASMQGGRAG